LIGSFVVDELNCRVRQEELLYVLKTLATLRVASVQDGGSDGKLNVLRRDQAESISDKVNKPTSSSHLVGFYPLLLDLSFMEHSVPSMWIYPSEHQRIFSDVAFTKVDEHVKEAPEIEDENQVVEVTSKDLAKKCLELIGRERSLE
jgi:hypothetical protein